MIEIGPLGESKPPQSHIIGKRFKKAIESTICQKKVHSIRLKFEDWKLQILDAAEANRLPPSFNAAWFYDVYYCDKKYYFLYSEFQEWLKMNGLTWSLTGYKDTAVLYIEPSPYVDFDDVEDIDVTSWKEILRK